MTGISKSMKACRKVKYNSDYPAGTRMWIFGMAQRSSIKTIIYPVDKRDAQTLIPLIEKQVDPGSRIFSDSWGAYLHLNELGNEHISVIHKSIFKQSYRNFQTGEIVICTTNRIEEACKYPKTTLEE